MHVEGCLLKLQSPGAPSLVGPGGYRIHSWKTRSVPFVLGDTCFSHSHACTSRWEGSSYHCFSGVWLKSHECAWLLGVGRGTRSMTIKLVLLPSLYAHQLLESWAFISLTASHLNQKQNPPIFGQPTVKALPRSLQTSSLQESWTRHQTP